MNIKNLNKIFRINTQFYKDRRFYEKQIKRMIIILIIIIIILILKRINSNFSNNVIRIIDKGVNYKFEIKKDGKKIIDFAKNKIKIPDKIVTVFNSFQGKEEYIVPMEGKIYKYFGEGKQVKNKVFNNGIDIIPASEGVAYSIGDGTVSDIEDKNSLGYFVTVDYGEISAVYGQMKEVHVEKGDKVAKGQKIGSLGNLKEGNRYLHFEIRVKGEPVNPEEYINF
ncbi:MULTISPECIES: murein hydrolase activator EnvC family protein [Tissierellales]|jgi:murein DD-endopeptidase MepM/ murein hydrolase activator NlpD|uniref:M23 family metallopeptidase n=1 Tax=Acidilutibacter cellobiosedens TaxID=2507161 RepID=A0A410QE56_9FIRM|nr:MULTISPECIES: M23 family metallopeptidase [Tissierellales]MBE6081262.1 M23 family metallopeptidase [Tissierellaceae bacterium]QAT62209.1 M23 family metallopeptidase [Acidilutibacter cellobiosedens]SCL84147.1 Stage II sporulation protein Q [Sporanaerobacter sp. PP17-6a]